MKKLVWLLIAIFAVSSVMVFGAMAPASQTEAEEAETRYFDAPALSTIASQDIYYTTRSVSKGETPGGAPSYCINNGLANCCGPLAGTEAVAYYDKYFPNLIAGWDSYYPESGVYRFQIKQYTDPVLYKLYDLMKCNVDGGGVTEASFMDGLETYFNDQGYSVSYKNVAWGNYLDYTPCVDAMKQNKIVVLFVTPGPIYQIAESSDHDSLIETNISGNHIMIAFGYLQMTYYLGGTYQGTKTYVQVSTGLPAFETAYYNVLTNNLQAAYVIDVA